MIVTPANVSVRGRCYNWWRVVPPSSAIGCRCVLFCVPGRCPAASAHLRASSRPDFRRRLDLPTDAGGPALRGRDPPLELQGHCLDFGLLAGCAAWVLLI